MKKIHVQPPVYDRLRMTIPVREALERRTRDALGAGNEVWLDDLPPSACLPGHSTYSVRLVRPPLGIVEVLIGHGNEQHRGLRLDSEPEYPGEWPEDSGAVAWHERGQWVPCPVCGAALVWYEAGYVPGYRICLRQHHAQLSSDGRSAKSTRRKGIS